MVGKEGKKPPILLQVLLLLLLRVLLDFLLLALAYVFVSALSMADVAVVMVLEVAAGLFLRVLVPRSCLGNHDAVDVVNKWLLVWAVRERQQYSSK